MQLQKKMKLTAIRYIIFVLTTFPGDLILALRDRQIQDEDDKEKWDSLFLDKTTADRRSGNPGSGTNANDRFHGSNNKLHRPVARTSVMSVLVGDHGIKDRAVDEGVLRGGRGEKIPNKALVRKEQGSNRCNLSHAFVLHIMKSNSLCF